MSNQPVSERIKILLEQYAQGNKAAMGRALGISGQAIADLIEGKKGGPSFPVLQKMLSLYSEVRAEWLIFGEKPMLRVSGEQTQIQSNPSIRAANDVDNELINELILTPEQWAKVIRAAAKMIMESEELKGRMALAAATGRAEADAEANIYWIGKPNSARPYNGLLTERLGISEEEAKQLILSGELPAGKFGKSNRITNYRVGERAIRKFLEGKSGDQQRAEYE